jgi:hypothetical protein
VAQFTNIHGLAPNVGKAGYLIGVNLDQVLYCSSAHSGTLGRTIMNLHLAGNVIVQVEDEDVIKSTLAKMGLGDIRWQLHLESLESRDD